MNVGAVIVMLKLLGESGLTTTAPPSTVSTVGTGWEVLTGAGVRGVDYTIDIDPTAAASWREEQNVIQAMHATREFFK